jgi:hypothetical protein
MPLECEIILCSGAFLPISYSIMVFDMGNAGFNRPPKDRRGSATAPYIKKALGMLGIVNEGVSLSTSFQ